jgi:hypothetical protein
VDHAVDVLEADTCFPEPCHLPVELQVVLAATYVPQLRAAGLNAAQQARAAAGEEPYATIQRRIVCRGCAVTSCPINPRHQPIDDFAGMRAQHRVDREAAAAEIIAAVTPDDLLDGVTIRPSANPSSKNPEIVFTITAGEGHRIVYCFIRTMVVRVGGNEQPLISIEQLREVLRTTALQLLA